MTEIVLVRHAQSANNALEEHLRVPDPSLTEIGMQQAAALAAWLRDQPIHHLYCSPFLRSLETMRPLAETKRLPVRIRSDLFELGGCYSGHEAGKQRGEPGLGRSQLVDAYPAWEIDGLIAESGWWGRDYESFEQGLLRAATVEKWLASEISSLGGIHVLIIHADFKRMLLQTMFNDQQLDDRKIDLAEVPLFNTGITLCVREETGWAMGDFNSTRHLPSKLVT